MHHFARQLGSPFPLLAAFGAKTNRIEIGTAVIDMRYENPLYMAEDAGAADLIAGGRLQLGISRGSPEQVIDGLRYFGYAPPEGMTDAEMARRHTEVFLEVLRGKGFAAPNPRPMFPNPPGLLRVEPYLGRPARPHLVGRRYQRHGGMGGEARHEPAKLDTQDRRKRKAVPRSAGRTDPALPRGVESSGSHAKPRMSVTRSIFALVDERDRAYFGRGGKEEDQVGMLSETERAIFGRSYAAEPDALIAQLKQDEAIAEADTLLLTVPNQLGVDYNAHVIEAILKHVAPGLGWR